MEKKCFRNSYDGKSPHIPNYKELLERRKESKAGRWGVAGELRWGGGREAVRVGWMKGDREVGCKAAWLA